MLGLGLHALIDDWRNARSVQAVRAQVTRVWAAGGVPAILDGESVPLGPVAEVRFRPAVVKVLGLPRDIGVREPRT